MENEIKCDQLCVEAGGENGAQGETLTALTQGLQLSTAGKAKVAHRFDTIMERKNRQIVFANGLFLDNAYKILPAFETNPSNQFFANVTNLNFSATQNSANRMNNWISSRTHSTYYFSSIGAGQ